MTGPEHFQEAERLLRPTTSPGPFADGSAARTVPPTPEDVAEATAHAILALAAATGLMVPEGGYGESSTWRAVVLPR